MTRTLVACMLLLFVCRATLADEPDARSTIAFGNLPLALAVTKIHGSGRRVFVTFEDPNCRYCKKLARELAKMDDITVHTFIFPILSADSMAKAHAIWCAADRAKAWNEWMTVGKLPRVRQCDVSALDAVLALGRRLNIRVTPTILLSDGERMSGLPDMLEFDMMISAPTPSSSQDV